MTDPELRATVIEGIEQGIRAFAWWKDGQQYVGTCGNTLGRAIEQLRSGRDAFFNELIEIAIERARVARVEDGA